MQIYKITVPLLEGEYWWGGIVSDGYMMPYGDGNIKRSLKEQTFNNQTAPFLVSNKGRYIYTDAAFLYEFKDRILYIESDNEIIFEQGYKTLKGAFLKASERHFAPNGKTPDSLMFTSAQYNSWIEMMYEPTAEKIIDYAKSIIENDMPTGVIMIDDNWQEDYGVWNFDAKRFPEPKKTIDTLHNMGFKVMLWVCNYISPDSYTFRELEKKGYLVKTKNGDSAIIHWWNGYSGMIDLTNPDAVSWLHGVFKSLMDKYGVDGFKFDAGDPEVFSENFVTYKKTTAAEYCKRWAQFGENYSFNEFRACYNMGGHGLAQRLCDKHHSWDEINGVASLIPNSLAQGIMGYAYNCPDMIGGGEFTAFLDNPELDEELIVRYAWCASLFAMMQFSVSPWRILSKDNLTHCILAAKLHKSFGEKIFKLAKMSAESGEPITRYMEYEFPNCGYEKITDQFMLGSDVLVAPVIKKGETSRNVVFPEGKWKYNGEIVEGPCTKMMISPIDTLLWFKKID